MLSKLAELGVPSKLLGLLKDILQKNLITIDNGVAERNTVEQTTGFAQGDNLSPQLFSLLINDLPSRIQQRHPFVKTTMYADDLVMHSRSRFHLQQSLATLGKYVTEIGLEINKTKTEAMKFRRGGRPTLNDSLVSPQENPH